jgi:hypothetical protein
MTITVEDLDILAGHMKGPTYIRPRSSSREFIEEDQDDFTQDINLNKLLTHPFTLEEDEIDSIAASGQNITKVLKM